MLKKLNRVVLPLIALLGLGVSVNVAEAHHAGSIYDTSKLQSFKVHVSKWQWSNPHSWIYLDLTTKDGKSETWAFECSSPNMMDRAGWAYSDFAVGDKVSIDAHPTRTGQHFGMLAMIFIKPGVVRADPVGGGRNVPGSTPVSGPAAPLPTKPQGTPYN